MVPKLKRCNHDERICRDCFNKHIMQQINGVGKFDNIGCPAEDCPHTLTTDEILQYCESDTYTRYNNLTNFRHLSNEPTFRWCKAEGCGSGQLHIDGRDYPIVKCNVCDARSCYIHEVPSHFGRTCEDYDQY